MSDKTYFEENGDALLRQNGISKTEFAEKMGVKKQNVNTLFATKNILILRKAAQVLDVPLERLIADADEKPSIGISGFVQVNERIFRIGDKSDLLNVISYVEELEQSAEYQNKIER